MVSQDIIFPLLPRNTSVDLKSGLDKVNQVQRMKKSSVVSEDESSDLQHARVEERQRRQQDAKQENAKQDDSALKEPAQEHEAQPSKPQSAHETAVEDDLPETQIKGQNLDTYA